MQTKTFLGMYTLKKQPRKSHRALEQLNVVGLLLTEPRWSPFSMPQFNRTLITAARSGGIVTSLWNKLQKLRNRAALNLTFSSYDTSAYALFNLSNLTGNGWILSDKCKWPPWSINLCIVLRPTILVLFSLNMIHLII